MVDSHWARAGLREAIADQPGPAPVPLRERELAEEHLAIDRRHALARRGRAGELFRDVPRGRQLPGEHEHATAARAEHRARPQILAGVGQAREQVEGARRVARVQLAERPVGPQERRLPRSLEPEPLAHAFRLGVRGSHPVPVAAQRREHPAGPGGDHPRVRRAALRGQPLRVRNRAIAEPSERAGRDVGRRASPCPSRGPRDRRLRSASATPRSTYSRDSIG